MVKEEINTALNTKFIGNDIMLFDTVSSTMDIARQEIFNNANEGLTIAAEHQTAGKGRRGKEWFCPKHKGLMITVILKPGIPQEKVHFIMAISAIAIVEAIKHLLHIQCAVKWPNDIMVNNKKVAGILIEVHGSYKHIPTFSVGIGINVNTKKKELPENTIVPPTSLAIETGETINRTTLLKFLLQSMDTWYIFLKDNQYEYIRERWRNLCLAYNQRLTIKDKDISYNGMFVDITPSGDLILELENNAQKIISKEDIVLFP